MVSALDAQKLVPSFRMLPQTAYCFTVLTGGNPTKLRGRRKLETAKTLCHEARYTNFGRVSNQFSRDVDVRKCIVSLIFSSRSRQKFSPPPPPRWTWRPASQPGTEGPAHAAPFSNPSSSGCGVGLSRDGCRGASCFDREIRAQLRSASIRGTE